MLLTSAKVPNDLEIYPTFNVDLTTTNEQHINSDLVTTFPNAFVQQGGSYSDSKVYVNLYGQHYDGSGGIWVEHKENNEIYYSVLGVNSTRVEYIAMKRETIVKDEVLATQSYVTNAISGAIAASY